MRCSSCTRDTGDRTSGERSPEISQYLQDNLPLGPGARKWLGTVENLDPALLSRYTMDTKSEGEAKSVITAVIAGILGKRLETWNLL